MFYVINRPFLGGKRSGIKLYKLDEAISPEQKASTRNPCRQLLLKTAFMPEHNRAISYNVKKGSLMEREPFALRIILFYGWKCFEVFNYFLHSFVIIGILRRIGLVGIYHKILVVVGHICLNRFKV